MDLHMLLREYVAQFNRDDEETIVNAVSNAQATEWLDERIPRVAVPDQEIERAYYFRWWTYRKHIERTPEGHVLTEFSTTSHLPWANKYNTISCAVGHHVDEGAWLREHEFLLEYIRFWYRGEMSALHAYGNWLEDAVARFCRLQGDWSLGAELLDEMTASYAYVEATQQHRCGAFFSIDDRDGHEYSVGGSGFRPTVNSYLYAGAKGIAEVARMVGRADVAEVFESKAEAVKVSAERQLWDEQARFYKTVPLETMTADALIPAVRPPHMDARELVGYLPWRFGMAPAGREDAFRQLLDPNGFYGDMNASTCERRHSDYLVTEEETVFNTWMHRYDRAPYNFGRDPEKDDLFRRMKLRGDWLCNEAGGVHMHACQWNGPSWPFVTSLMLGAVANLLADYPSQSALSREDYLHLLHRYAASHQMVTEDGRTVSWVDEAQNPDTNEWIVRKIYYNRKATIPGIQFPTGIDRGKDYNHSSYCDLVLGGLFGIRPETDNVRIVPLFPASWAYAHLEEVSVHGHLLDVHYEQGKGYRVLVDGREAFVSAEPEACRLEI